MKGFDLLLDRLYPVEHVKQVLVNSLNLSNEKVMVTDEIPIKKLATNIALLVVTSHVRGQFKMLLELYFQLGYTTSISEQELATKMCRELSCACLISDSDTDPYAMFKLESDGSVYKVSLNVAALDDDSEYIVDKILPFSPNEQIG